MRNGWKTAVLEDLYAAPSRNGLTRPKKVRGSGYPMINMGEIFAHDRIGNVEMELVPMNESEIERFSVEPGDLLFARQSLVAAGAGKCSIVKEVPKPTTFESHLIRLRLDESRVDPDFYFYYFKSPEGKANVQSLVMQVAAAGIRGSELAKLTVPLPELPTQRRIAGILSAYDDLIENNLRRIRILEEMAQSLYREWFVHFRIPSEVLQKAGLPPEITLVESPLGPIPKGWEVKRLEEVTSKIGSGATPKGGKDAYKTEGISLIRSLNIFDYEFKHNNLAFIDDEQAAKLSNVVVEEYDVLLNITGASVARCSMVPSAVLPARVNQHVAIIRANGDSDPFYILDTINSDERKRQILSMAQGGATREALTKTTINNLEIAMPSAYILQHYSKIRRNLFNERQALAQKNQNLRHTRDLLLPKFLASNTHPPR